MNQYNQDRIKQLINLLRIDSRNTAMWLELESLTISPTKRKEILEGILLYEPGNAEVFHRLNILESELGREPEISLPDPVLEQPDYLDNTQKITVSQSDTAELEKDTADFQENLLDGYVRCPHCGNVFSTDNKAKRPPEISQGTPPKQPKVSPLVFILQFIFIVLGIITGIVAWVAIIQPLFFS